MAHILKIDHAESCLTVLICYSPYTGYQLKHPKRALSVSCKPHGKRRKHLPLISKGPNRWMSGINNAYENIQSCFISSNKIPSGYNTCVSPMRFPAGVTASWICVSRSLQKCIGSVHWLTHLSTNPNTASSDLSQWVAPH